MSSPSSDIALGFEPPSRPLRIGVNASFLGSKNNGIATYTRGMLSALRGEHRLILYASDALELPHSAVRRSTPQRVTADCGRSANLARFVWTQTELRRRLTKDNLDVLITPNVEGLIASPVPQIIQIHDLIPFFFPEECPRLTWYYRVILPRILRSTARVFVDSEHTRQDVMRYYSFPANRIDVVYPGLDERFFEDAARARRGQSLTDPYFLFVGAFAIRKNLDTVIRAFARISESLSHKMKVVAYPDPAAKRIRSLCSDLDIHERVLYLNGLSVDELISLYRNATALILLSDYEGFGYPPVEAMACGTPSIVSDSTSLTEIVGEAGVKVDNHDVDQVAAAMYRIATDHSYRQNLSDASMRRARLFTWENAAKQIRKGMEQASYRPAELAN
jgi:glycosyltransferase involved in cell wall biosynthesis